MPGVFDDLMFLVRPGMVGYELFFVINGNELVVGLEGQGHGNVGERNTIAVGVETDKPLGRALYRADDSGVVVDLRQRNQERLLLFSEELNGPGFCGPVDTYIGCMIPPCDSLLVAIGE